MRYRHRYKIAEDYFLRMAMERRWQLEPVHGLLYVCELPRERARGRRRGRPLHRRLRGAGERVLPHRPRPGAPRSEGYSLV